MRAHRERVAQRQVGLATLQVAERVGARAIALTRAAAKREALLDRGAAAVIVTGTEDVVDRTFTLDEIVKAHRHLESNAQVGKIVVAV
ncbi:zinc-binding dehydrogenase [Spirillospora sp. NPDC047279]|uniref:zinc-binding dehydrogenase n=1 Tax=Spirillospora sp. NPDC047279 TaxID=3155478 RepID=UPI0033F6D2C2